MNYLPRMERVTQLHRDRAITVGIALAAAWLFWLIADVAGSFTWLGLAATVVATVVILGNSDSVAGLILLAAMALQWWLAGPAVDSWWIAPEAWLLLTAHSAVALAASGPDAAPIPRAVGRTWTTRTLLVGLATTVVAVLGILIEPTDNSLMPYGVATALLALCAAVLVLIRLTRAEDKQAPGTAAK